MRELFKNIKDALENAKKNGSTIKICIAAAESLVLIAEELREIKEELRKLNQVRVVTQPKT